MTELGYSVLYKLPFGWQNHVLTLTQTLERRESIDLNLVNTKGDIQDGLRRPGCSVQWGWEELDRALPYYPNQTGAESGWAHWGRAPATFAPFLLAKPAQPSWPAHFPGWCLYLGRSCHSPSCGSFQPTVFPFLSSLGSHSIKWGRWQGAKCL